MPYIYCDDCGTGSYSNVLSCPRCGKPTRQMTAREVSRGRARRKRVLYADEDVEAEVRKTLYGWHSGTVARVTDGGHRMGSPAEHLETLG